MAGATTMGLATALALLLVACSSHTREGGTIPATTRASAGTSSSTSTSVLGASTSEPTAPSTSAVSSTTGNAGQPACSSRSGPYGTLTVCPGAAPVGARVTITGKGCHSTSTLVFLGPGAYLGSGGGGNDIPMHSDSQGNFQLAYTIPSTYESGGTSSHPVSTIPGNGYEFGSYPGDLCSAPFTVTSR